MLSQERSLVAIRVRVDQLNDAVTVLDFRGDGRPCHQIQRCVVSACAVDVLTGFPCNVLVVAQVCVSFIKEHDAVAGIKQL